MAAHVCCMCGGAGKQDKIFECVRCHDRQHKHCHSLGKILTRFILCDFCLKEKPHQEGVAKWVRSLLAIDFSERCELYYCCKFTSCYEGFCGRCCPASDGHKHDKHRECIILVMQHGELLLIRPEDVEKFYNCSDIKPEIPDWVLLHPKPGAPLGGERSCARCHREIFGAYRYCSIACKFGVDGWLVGLENSMFVSRLLNHDFEAGHKWDFFCAHCCTAFHSGLCEHHNMHWPTIRIEETSGCFFVYLTGEERWIGAFAGIQDYRYVVDGADRRLVHLRPPPPPQPWPLPRMSCQCGNHVTEDMWYCSVLCMANYGSAS